MTFEWVWMYMLNLASLQTSKVTQNQTKKIQGVKEEERIFNCLDRLNESGFSFSSRKIYWILCF